KVFADYEKELPEKAAEWLIKADAGTTWKMIKPKDLKTTAFLMTLKKQKDGSILSEGGNGESEYTITAETDLTGITGALLELLPDDSLPKFGPGRAKDGTFTLNEFQLRVAPKSNPESDVSVKFTDAKADFSQKEH